MVCNKSSFRKKLLCISFLYSNLFQNFMIFLIESNASYENNLGDNFFRHIGSAILNL